MAGLEPARTFSVQRILSPLRLPFRHIGVAGVNCKLLPGQTEMDFTARTDPARLERVLVLLLEIV